MALERQLFLPANLKSVISPFSENLKSIYQQLEVAFEQILPFME